MVKVKIKQFRNKAKEPVAGLTPEHAIYDANGVRLDAKLGNVNLQDFRDLQQKCVNDINAKVVEAKAEIDDKHEEVAQLSQASMVGTSTTGLSGTNVQENLNDAGERLSELEGKVAAIDGGNVTLVPEWNNDGAYNRVGIKNIASGVNTDLIDVSGYTSFSVSGSLGVGSVRYSIFYKADGGYIAVSEEEFENKSVESVDLTDIVSMKLSFANANNKTIRLSNDGEIPLLKKKIDGVETRLRDAEEEIGKISGGYTDISLTFIDGGAYNAGDQMNGTPSISSGKYTKAIDEATEYKKGQEVYVAVPLGDFTGHKRITGLVVNPYEKIKKTLVNNLKINNIDYYNNF